ncbi:MAG TPA: EamA family transporter [Sphingomicrobium sp.]|nr:EamA family transporter [Sphingomicrobium sp.]
MSEGSGSDFRSIALPFAIFTAIWGSTWIVIIGQLGTVPGQWSVTYRFAIAAVAMAILARIKRRPLILDGAGYRAAVFIGIAQFGINFNSVYLAERHITSGVVATIFALLLIPNTLLGWALLGQRPSTRFAVGSAVAVAGITLLCINELRSNAGSTGETLVGIGVTIVGLISASSSNVYQAREHVRRHHLASLLAWSMAFGALIDAAFAWITSGAPEFDGRPEYWAGLLYLACAASALSFSLYFPVVRKIGPAKAAYSSVLVPIIAMAFSTALEGYRWTALAAAGALLTLVGMLLAMSSGRLAVQSPDAA